MAITIQASEFKAKCLKLLEEVQNGKTYLITKRGVPLAKLEPLPSEVTKIFGAMKNSVTVVGDLRDPLDEEWEAQE